MVKYDIYGVQANKLPLTERMYPQKFTHGLWE